jgi:hypothetical protein
MAARRSGLEVGAEARHAALEFLRRLRARIEAIHLAGEALEFGKRHLAGAALGGGRRDQRAVGCDRRRRERRDAPARQRGDENVGRGREVVLRVPAYELEIFREGDVAFNDSGAHACARLICLTGMLGKLQRRAAVADGEIGAVERSVAAARELRLERAVLHVVDHKERPRPELNTLVALPIAAVVVAGMQGRGESG